MTTSATRDRSRVCSLRIANRRGVGAWSRRHLAKRRVREAHLIEFVSVRSKSRASIGAPLGEGAVWREADGPDCRHRQSDGAEKKRGDGRRAVVCGSEGAGPRPPVNQKGRTLRHDAWEGNAASDRPERHARAAHHVFADVWAMKLRRSGMVVEVSRDHSMQISLHQASSASRTKAWGQCACMAGMDCDEAQSSDCEQVGRLVPIAGTFDHGIAAIARRTPSSSSAPQALESNRNCQCLRLASVEGPGGWFLEAVFWDREQASQSPAKNATTLSPGAQFRKAPRGTASQSRRCRSVRPVAVLRGAHPLKLQDWTPFDIGIERQRLPSAAVRGRRRNDRCTFRTRPSRERSACSCGRQVAHERTRLPTQRRHPLP